MKLQTIDIETIGRREGDALRPWEFRKNSWILCTAVIGINIHTGNMVIDCYNSETTNWNIDDLDMLDSNAVLCGWNLKFDLSFLYAAGAKIDNTKFLDGMLLLKRLAAHNPKYAQRSYGLKKTLETYSEFIDDYVFDYSDDIDFKPMTPEEVTPEFYNKMAEYCLRDAQYTHALIKHLIPLCPKHVLVAAILESTAAALFAKSVVIGQQIDKSRLTELFDSNADKIRSLEEKLNLLGCTEDVIRSPKKLSDFFTQKGIKNQNLTSRGSVSVRKSVLKKLRLGNLTPDQLAIINSILDLKELLTERDKFLKPAAELDCSHADVFMNSTYTGRLTYSVSQTIKTQTKLKNGKIRESKTQIRTGLPLHQFKRGELRSIIRAPEGYKLVEIDFSGQEMRLMAAIAQETKMLELFNSGVDLHSYTGASIANVDYAEFPSHPEFKTFRQLGKITNLALQYRLSAQGLYDLMHLTYGMDVTLEQVTEMREKYLALYPRIAKYWDEHSHKARREEFVYNMAGRRHWFEQGAEDWERCQQAINFPIQSTGAEQKLLFLASAYKFMQDNNIILGWDLHDGLYFYVPILPPANWNDETKRYDHPMAYSLDFFADHTKPRTTKDLAMKLAAISENLDYKKFWGWEPPLQFPVEVKIGDNWGELKKVGL